MILSYTNAHTHTHPYTLTNIHAYIQTVDEVPVFRAEPRRNNWNVQRDRHFHLANGNRTSHLIRTQKTNEGFDKAKSTTNTNQTIGVQSRFSLSLYVPLSLSLVDCIGIWLPRLKNINEEFHNNNHNKNNRKTMHFQLNWNCEQAQFSF